MKTKEILCDNCKTPFKFRIKDYINKTYKRRFCSKKCELLFKAVESVDNAIEELTAGTLSDDEARRAFRKISEKTCAICGLSEWNNNSIPLVVDHIDGDHSNNFISNLRMVCCNCDAQLPTYKGRNKGNGRAQRRARP